MRSRKGMIEFCPGVFFSPKVLKRWVADREKRRADQIKAAQLKKKNKCP